MEQGLDKNGRVVYLKDDGSIAKVQPSTQVVLETLGYPVTYGNGVNVELGDPYEDDAVVATVWSSSRASTYLLQKGAEEGVVLGPESGEAMREGHLNLENAMDYALDQPSEEVDPEEFAQQEGLEVVEMEGGYFINDKYRPSNKLFRSLPVGWGILKRGDAALTRAVKRAGPYWNLLRYAGKHRSKAGVCAPAETIKGEADRLGAQAASGAEPYRRKRAEKREQQLTREFKRIMRSEFPFMPDEDVEAVTQRARREGVGRAQWLYIQKSEEKEAKFREAVTLAAGAHARHRYTDYDEIVSPGATQEDRREVRTEIRPEVNRKLEEWRKGIQKED